MVGWLARWWWWNRTSYTIDCYPQSMWWEYNFRWRGSVVFGLCSWAGGFALTPRCTLGIFSNRSCTQSWCMNYLLGQYCLYEIAHFLWLGDSFIFEVRDSNISGPFVSITLQIATAFASYRCSFNNPSYPKEYCQWINDLYFG